MSVTTIEGIIKEGKVVIPDNYRFPESSLVYVIVPDHDEPKRVMSPRLADPSKFAELKREVFDIEDDEV